MRSSTRDALDRAAARHIRVHLCVLANAAIMGLALIGIAAALKSANAWWRGRGGGVGIHAPPFVVAPTARAWVPAHWENRYWVGGH